MRLLRLDIEGFGTFRDAVSLDFSDTDYFVLVGPTGSGKTTIIDAISFALYGAVPRWPRSDQVSLAMAPSVGHTRACLIFEAGGRRYAALRVLAKSARGQVTTKQSRLITLPAELDLSQELGDVLAAELEPIADAPGDMQEAVEHLLGLRYEHFMQSVVLPQGEFAKFLNAKRRDRQDLLVALLGLGVYEQVMQRANSRADQARTRAAALDDELGKYADATAAAQHAATDERSRLSGFQKELPSLLEPWKSAAAELETATELSSAYDADLRALAAVRAPADLDTLAQQRAEAAAVSAQAAQRVAEAEQHESDTEQTSQAAGKPSDWQNLITLHDQLGAAAEKQTAAAAAVTKTAEDGEAAQTACDHRQRELDEARAALDHARTAHAADHLASGLEAGAACPVCRQIVSEVPQRPSRPEIDDAQQRVASAEQNLATAQQSRQTAQRAADRAVDERDRLVEQIADLHDQLADRPDAETASAAYESAKQAEHAATTARQTVRDAREAQRTADETGRSLEQHWAETGRQLSTARDTVAHLGPPVSSGEHGQDWLTLTQWAETKHAELGEQVKDAVTRRDHAVTTERSARHQVIAELERHQITAPEEFTETAVVTAVTSAVNAAQYKLDRIAERRDEAAQLAEDISAHRNSAELDKDLGNLLNARNFERWIVHEALQAMMIEASTTLSELSGGQFELTTDDKQDIYVIDHNDASSQRPVQTLSGGETFQASLALALALSSQITALSASTGPLDTLLLDEGFGTLDPSTLDVVAGTLEQLAGGGERMVGLVTHVAALAERIPVRFEVRREGTRSTVEKVTG